MNDQVCPLICVLGMGFKQAPVIGQILADLVNGSEQELLVDELRFKRFSS